MKILILTWFFPPMNHVASGRPYSWACHLADAGHQVTVITPQKDPQVHGPLSMTRQTRANLTLMETPLFLRRTPRGKALTWTLGTARRVASTARGQDVVISTYPYANAHALGRVAKSAARDCLWCADYRDLWHDNYLWSEGRPLRRWFLGVFERRLMRGVGLTVTVSEPLAERLRKTHPQAPCEVIYNGFEARDYTAPQPETRLARRAEAGEPFRILYTGTLYRGYQNPEPLFAALAKGQWRRPVRLAFFGPSAREDLLRQLTAKYGLGSVVELPERILSRADSLAAQRDSDLLLHLGWTDVKNDGWLSGKVFEYMASGTPVLSVGAGATTALGRLLESSGTGLAAGTDVEGIAGTLDRMINQGRHPSWYQPRPHVVEGYSREAQATKLMEALERLRKRVPGRLDSPAAGAGRNDLRGRADSGTSSSNLR